MTGTDHTPLLVEEPPASSGGSRVYTHRWVGRWHRPDLGYWYGRMYDLLLLHASDHSIDECTDRHTGEPCAIHALLAEIDDPTASQDAGATNAS